MHRLLRRQIAKHIRDFDALGDEVKSLLAAVDEAYEQADNDRLLLERSLDLSSQELMERHARLADHVRELELTREQLRQNQLHLAHVVRLTSMGEMAAGIAHELNQPLAAIVAYIGGGVGRLKSGEPPSPDIIEAFEKAAQQSQRAGQIIRRIREFIRRDDQRTEPIDVNLPVGEAVDMLGAAARAENVAISVDLAHGLPRVMADVVQIQQVAVNLGRNGIDALSRVTGRPRRLDFRTFAEGGRIAVAVRDNGDGLSEQARQMLFTPFFTTKPEGLGMGLAICRTIAEIHGGDLRFVAPDDGGAEFRLSLPAWMGEKPPAAG